MNIIWQARKLLCPVERAIPISWNDGTDIAGTTDQFIRRVVETTYLMCRATDWFMLGQRVNSQRLLKEIESTVAVLQQMQTIFTQSGAAPQNSISADEFVTAFDISRWLSMRMTDIKYLADMYVQRKSSGTQELSCDDEKFISLNTSVRLT